ncbi:MAG: response regulator [Gammaproteobacteria bacterium]|nr:response regulator [Gammaproteobacteria bacterium]
MPVLVVDDNEVNLRLTRVVLLKSGSFEVRTANSAEAALTVLAEFRPRLILMDIQMPGMDGLTLTRLLKSKPETRDIVVVALTAYAMKGDEERAYAAGCSGYITKPIDTETFGSEVVSYLGGPLAPPS